jgi:trehalose 6-phosphate phosphatase
VLTTDEVIDALRADASRAGIFTDFDGTIAPIVDRPEDARPLDGVAASLERLGAEYAIVAVLSGRPVAFLQRWLPPSIVLSGLYGLEVVHNGVRTEHASADAWRSVIAGVADDAHDDGPQGMRVEPKGLSLTLHYRGNPELAPSVLAYAERAAARTGLSVRPARMSVELHPPIEADKGTALRELATGLHALCFIGDDVGDLPAFDALDELAGPGVTAVRIAVRSEESPAHLLDKADLVVDGPAGARDLFSRL